MLRQHPFCTSSSPDVPMHSCAGLESQINWKPECDVVQLETPLEEAKQLSLELGNTLLLKREDLQTVPGAPSIGLLHLALESATFTCFSDPSIVRI